MDKFIIYFINNFVSVYHYEDKLTPLKYEGEEKFKYNNNFWEWFQRKIEYSKEELSFVIISDKEFKIPDEIVISKKSNFNNLPPLKVPENSKIYTFPKIKENINEIKKKSDKKTFLDFFIDKSVNKS